MLVSSNSKDRIIGILIGVATLLVLFRLTFAALLDVREHTGIFIAISLALFGVVAIWSKSFFGVFKRFDYVHIVLWLNLFLLIVFSLLNENSLQMIKVLSPSNGILILLLMLLNLRVSTDRLLKLLDIISLSVVLVGGGFFIIESLGNRIGVTDAAYWKDFFFHGVLEKFSMTKKYPKFIGFLGKQANSLGAIIGCSHYLLARFFVIDFSKRSMAILWFLTIAMGAVTCFVGNSITSAISFAIITMIIFFLYCSTKKGLIKYWFFMLVLLVLAFAFSGPAHHLNEYFTRYSYLFVNFIPKISGCDISILWSAFGKNCTVGEFHVLGHSMLYGLWVFLPQLLIFLFIFDVFRRREEVLLKSVRFAPFILCLSLGVSSAHYKPISSWGPNLLFMIAFIVIYKTSARSSLDKNQ